MPVSQAAACSDAECVCGGVGGGRAHRQGVRVNTTERLDEMNVQGPGGAASFHLGSASQVGGERAHHGPLVASQPRHEQ